MATSSVMDALMTPNERKRLIVERTLAAERNLSPVANPARGALDGISIEPPDLRGARLVGIARQRQIAAALVYMKGR